MTGVEVKYLCGKIQVLRLLTVTSLQRDNFVSLREDSLRHLTMVRAASSAAFEAACTAFLLS